MNGVTSLITAAITTASILLGAGPALGQQRPQDAGPQDTGPQDARPQDGASSQPSSIERTLQSVQQAQQQLLRRVKELERKNQQQSIEILRMEGEAQAATGGEVVQQADRELDLKEKVFRGGQRALQALNPELSLVGDGLGTVILNEDGYASEGDRSGFFFRMIGAHFQADLDPFSFTKITVGITPSGASLGEAYMTWTSLLPGVSLTVGKFRQELGVVNRWHLPGLDQYDWPLAMREMLGAGGLCQVGLSIDWLMPSLWAHVNHLVLQVTNGSNDRLFAGKFWSVPALLLRIKSYYDLTGSTYFELGLSGMLGWNNTRGKQDAEGELQDETWRPTGVWGADWSLVWEPPRQAKYRNVVLRGELYGVRKESKDGATQALGLYQYVQTKLNRHWEVGARFDWTMPLIQDNEDQFVVGVQPYVTWWQSPWVRVRLHYAYAYSVLDAAPRKYDHRLILQATFAAGPHKHERY